MSGRTFTYTAGFDSFVSAILPDLDGSARRHAGGVGDGMLRDVEEFINRFCVTATNDAGDITFDAAGTYTFAGSVVIDGTLTTNGNTTVNGNVDVVASAGGGITMTTSGGTTVSSWLSSQNAGWRFMPSTADWQEGEVGIIPSNRTLANEFWALVLRSPYYDNPTQDYSEINLYSESEDGTVIPRINMDAGLWDFDLNSATGVSMSYLGSDKWTVDSNGYMYAAGRIGVGVTSPSVGVHVESTTTADVELLRLSAAWSAVDRYGFITGVTSSDDAILAAIGLGTAADGANNNDGGIIFQTTTAATTALSGLTTAMSINHQGNVAIGTHTPEDLLHMKDGRAWMENSAGGDSAVSAAEGFLVTANGMNTTSKYTPGYMFGSTDAAFTTTNPKVNAGIYGRATETYGNDSDSGMAIEVRVAQTNLGTGNGVAFTSRGYQMTAANLSPLADNAQDLGTGSLRYDDVFATNTTIQTSDLRDKDNVADLDLGLAFLKTLRPVSFTWSDRSGYVGSRTHMGFVAQEVAESLGDAALGRALWVDMPADPEVEGSVDRQALRQGELIAPLVAAVQELAARIEALEA